MTKGNHNKIRTAESTNIWFKREDHLENLQDAVTVASVAEILESKVPLALWELVSESFLELRTRSAHETINQIPEFLYRSLFNCFSLSILSPSTTYNESLLIYSFSISLSVCLFLCWFRARSKCLERELIAVAIKNFGRNTQKGVIAEEPKIRFGSFDMFSAALILLDNRFLLTFINPCNVWCIAVRLRHGLCRVQTNLLN